MSKLPPKAPDCPKAVDDDGYRVGPGRPPRHTQFKKGQSGNPGGRKKNPFDLVSLLREEAMRPVAIKGSTETLPAAQALVRMLVQQALKGDARARRDLLDRLERSSGSPPDLETAVDDLTEDEELVARAMRRRLAARAPADGDEDDGGRGDDDV